MALTIDLLQLRNHAELFSVAEGVPVNEYAVVCLYVEQVELIDTRTTPETRDIAQLPRRDDCAARTLRIDRCSVRQVLLHRVPVYPLWWLRRVPSTMPRVS